MFQRYRKTHLEDYVEQLFLQHSILSPEDITIGSISEGMNIKTEYAAIKSTSLRSASGKHIIILDKRNSSQKQREDFLHELGHLLRHEGNQILLPKPFVQYQEEDAEQFVLYALMPFFMIDALELSPDRKQAIQQLSDVFAVGISLASKRYDQIVRREFDAAITATKTVAIGKRLNSVKEVKPIDAYGPQFKVYYDPTGTMDGPSQMVVFLDERTQINCREIELPIGERLPEIDPDELNEIECTPVQSTDIGCFDGVVTLSVNELVFRYGLSKRKFIINMNVVDMLIARDQAVSRRLSW
ncbi:ImmA/IrrE family metallo-endopeptidase [Paenibacillus lutimineralis]|uniref:ImmA/IrrE family metallo-endopeptidase n=1 Tax=Paenibacillus lutimineralis TaxID=2707005 RepID=A0A3S9V4C7_9BACL|nr:ImmA/IrrE family metallo-endopeptidase [Paenibacillus lutimineralis]AZS17416.1 ImmA/IrrE family metallo-endopeptidase [Paenibacillus lutimineralis]